MVNDAVRCAPVLAATVSVTLPFPLPLPPPTVIHAAGFAVDQAQPAPAVTLTDVVSPEAADERELEEIAYEQGAAASCVTLKVWPAMVAVPVRALVAVFAATARLTVPLPLPLAPLATLSHAAPLDAVQAQPAGLVTATVSVSPAATAVPLPGAIE
jgi:hypothetical protein